MPDSDISKAIAELDEEDSTSEIGAAIAELDNEPDEAQAAAIAADAPAAATAAPGAPESHWYDFLVPSPERRARAKQEQEKELQEASAAWTELGSQSGPEIAKRIGLEQAGRVGSMALGAVPATGIVKPALLSGAGGAVDAGTHALATGADWADAGWEATKSGLASMGLTGLLGLAGKGGKWLVDKANRKLADAAMPAPELQRIELSKGDEGLAQAGQDLRDAGATNSKGVDVFRSASDPEVLKRNVQREMKAAGRAGEAAEDEMLEQMALGGPVKDRYVDVSPVRSEMQAAADRLRYRKADPSGASAYEELAERFTTPAQPYAPVTPFADLPPSAMKPPPQAEFTPSGIHTATQPDLPTPPPDVPPVVTPPAPGSQLPLDLPPAPGPPGVQEGLPLPHPEEWTRVGREPQQPPLPLPPTEKQMPLPLEPPAPSTKQIEIPEALASAPADPPIGSTAGPQSSLDFGAGEQLGLDLSRPATPRMRAPVQQDLALPGLEQQSFDFGPRPMTPVQPPEVPLAQASLPFDRTRAPVQNTLNLNPMPESPQLDLPLPGQLGFPFPQTPARPMTPAATLPPRRGPEQMALGFPPAEPPARPPQPYQSSFGFEQPAGTQLELPLPGQMGLPFPARPPAPEVPAAPPPVSPDQTSFFFPPRKQPPPLPKRPPLVSGPQQTLPGTAGQERSGYRLGELVESARQAGKEASPAFHGGSEMNKAPSYLKEARKDLAGAARRLVTKELDSLVDMGIVRGEAAAARAAANKKYSKLATVAPGLTKQSIAARKAAARGQKAPERSLLRMGAETVGSALAAPFTGVNSGYNIGRGGEALGAAAPLSRYFAGGGGFRDEDRHPQVEQAKQENPTASVAEQIHTANDAMKDALMGQWYNGLLEWGKDKLGMGEDE